MEFREPSVEYVNLALINTTTTSQMGSNVCQGTDDSLNFAAYCAETWGVLHDQTGLDKNTVCGDFMWNAGDNTFTPS